MDYLPNPKWDDERVAKLKQLYADGHSFLKISKELGFNTRNAVIGKIHRLGLSRTEPNRLSKSLRISIKLKDKDLKRRIATIRKHRYREPLLVVPAAPPSRLDKAIPRKQRCDIFGLTNETCRWPIGEPTSPGFFYCGAAANLNEGQPYCPRHATLAYRGAWGT